MKKEKIFNWMKYPPMFRLYEQAQTAKSDLEIDIEFLSDPYLGRYPEDKLNKLELPETIYSFLNQIGLPDRFSTWRSPDEEIDDKSQDTYLGVVFSLRCLCIQKVNRRKFLIIGENWNLNRYSIINNDLWTWWKTENCSYYIVVELKTGIVWQWISYADEDFFTYINSSLEQYVLSMAYWRKFYPNFAQKVKQFTLKNPEKTELDCIFKYQKSLYAPFLQRIKALDPDAAKKRQSYWKFMCDLSLY